MRPREPATLALTLVSSVIEDPWSSRLRLGERRALAASRKVALPSWPKVYLRERPGDAVYSHDAVDGQQRLRAIWEFKSGQLTLDYAERLPDVGSFPIFGLTYDQLDQSLRDRFDNFEVSIGEILNATNDDISALFARLQMGVPLNPAELRNAQLRPLNRIIASIAESHEFFHSQSARRLLISLTARDERPVHMCLTSRMLPPTRNPRISPR